MSSPPSNPLSPIDARGSLLARFICPSGCTPPNETPTLNIINPPMDCPFGHPWDVQQSGSLLSLPANLCLDHLLDRCTNRAYEVGRITPTTPDPQVRCISGLHSSDQELETLLMDSYNQDGGSESGDDDDQESTIRPGSTQSQPESQVSLDLEGSIPGGSQEEVEQVEEADSTGGIRFNVSQGLCAIGILLGVVLFGFICGIPLFLYWYFWYTFENFD